MKRSMTMIENDLNLSESEKQQYKNFLAITESMGLDEFLELIQYRGGCRYCVNWMAFVEGYFTSAHWRKIGTIYSSGTVRNPKIYGKHQL